jgi:hypothetical protein
MKFTDLVALRNRPFGFSFSSFCAFAVFSALLISSALAIESITHIHIIANALPTALVSAFSNALVLLINQSHRLA